MVNMLREKRDPFQQYLMRFSAKVEPATHPVHERGSGGYFIALDYHAA